MVQALLLLCGHVGMATLHLDLVLCVMHCFVA